jgi:hypothetical protein
MVGLGMKREMVERADLFFVVGTVVLMVDREGTTSWLGMEETSSSIG